MPECRIMLTPGPSMPITPYSSLTSTDAVSARFKSTRASLLKLRAQLVDANRKSDDKQVAYTAKYQEKVVYEQRPTYASKNVYGTRDTFENRNITQQRDIFEARPIYTQRAIYTDTPILDNSVSGTQSLSSYTSALQAGLLNSDFSVTVGTNSAAVVKFNGSNVAVTVGATTNTFSTAAGSGGFTGGLRNALNSISGLNATIGSDGKLTLKTTSAQSLNLAEVANGFLDLSATSLDKLGLLPGRYEAKITGYNHTQTGSEQIQTGIENVKTGTETVLVGTERVKTGTESYLTGSEQVVSGTQSYASLGKVFVGYDKTQTNGDANSLLTAKRRAAEAQSEVASLSSTLSQALGDTGAIGKSINGQARVLYDDLNYESLIKSGGSGLKRLDRELKRLDSIHAAYFTAGRLAATMPAMTGLSILS